MHPVRAAGGNIGAATATTPTAGDNSTKVATTAFVAGANAATATKLATARNIAGHAFDGSANISISCADLSDDAASCATDATDASNISSGTLDTARLPSPFTSGTRSGNTSKFVTTTGSLTSGNCAKWDADGNLVDAGAACGTGSGGSTDASLLQNYLSGLTLSNNGTTPDTKLDVAAGVATDSTNSSFIKLSSSVIIDTGTTGALGLDAGTLAASTTYHVFLIGKTDGTASALASTSASSPTMPSGYTLKRRIGSFMTDSSTHIIAFVQHGDRFELSVPVSSSVTSPGTTSSLYDLDVPTGIKIEAVIWMFAALDASKSSGSAILATDPDQADTSPSISSGFPTLANLGIRLTGQSYGMNGNFHGAIWTNTEGQIRLRRIGDGLV